MRHVLQLKLATSSKKQLFFPFFLPRIYENLSPFSGFKQAYAPLINRQRSFLSGVDLEVLRQKKDINIIFKKTSNQNFYPQLLLQYGFSPYTPHKWHTSYRTSLKTAIRWGYFNSQYIKIRDKDFSKGQETVSLNSLPLATVIVIPAMRFSSILLLSRYIFLLRLTLLFASN